MNLDECTPGQRASIEHVEGPLLVSAGAGSGKTFTLTQRIAYALLPASGPAARGIDEVLAITFTEKAAAEIKARVKRTLRAEGLPEEALKVDAAWISTIHGMCARILRTHALELGLDPTFGIMADAERADLIAVCINEVLGEDNSIIEHGSYASLFDEYPARSTLPTAPSVSAMLEAVMDRAVGLRGGLAAVSLGPAPTDASRLARELLLAFEEVLPSLERGGSSAAAEKALRETKDAIELLQAWLEEERTSKQDALLSFAAVVNRCEYIPCTFGNAEVKQEIRNYQEVHARISRSIVLGLAWPCARELLALAHEVVERFEAKKRAVCKLDNDDLLTKTLEAFEKHPEIAQRYEKQFKLVMVDEFQDTSQLQIDMISRLAGPHCAHLCTVGDAQQSIYRFRGADVNVYEAHKRAMRSDEVGALYIELSKNFRSHGDVLSFVDRIFEQPQVFGENFMSLEPHAGRRSTYRAATPRIDLVLALQPSGKGTGVTVEDAKRTCARAIAKRFSALREQGHASRDMVILLGKMGRAEVYAQALRDEGFECAVTGGSLFSRAPEVRVVSRFVQALANPANTAALFEVLTSDMLRLSPDDLLELATEEDEKTGALRRRDLDRGFMRLRMESGTLSPCLSRAMKLFFHAQQETRMRPLSQVVQDAVVQSGWMARLQRQGAQGLAQAANILKAIRFIGQLEEDRQGGLAYVAQAFSNELDAGMKEAPGALSGSGGDVVKIMTIHASKGLEFPIVALADFAGAGMPGGKLVVETCGTTAYVSLAAGSSMERYPNLAKRAVAPAGEAALDDPELISARRFLRKSDQKGETIQEDTCSQDAYRNALKEQAACEELAEARRKLYVGLTRASEALIVAIDAKASRAGKLPAYPPLVDDIRSALCGAGDFPEGSELLEYGGSEPACFERILIAPEEADAVSEAQDSAPFAPFVVPRLEDFVRASYCPWRASGSDTFSYSSIAASHDDESIRAGEDNLEEPDQSPLDFLKLFAGDGPLLGVDEEASERMPSDADKATGLGSAFHRAAQFAVETGCTPTDERLQSLARALALSQSQQQRFRVACERWFASSVYAETLRWARRQAEVPFFISIGDVFMEGEIDLLCTEESTSCKGKALVIDYKTGGSDAELPDQVYQKHLLQAQCYAYALLRQGFEEIELRFVRVERVQDESTQEPQVACYRFDSADRDFLECHILERRQCALRGVDAR